MLSGKEQLCLTNSYGKESLQEKPEKDKTVIEGPDRTKHEKDNSQIKLKDWQLVG